MSQYTEVKLLPTVHTILFISEVFCGQKVF